MKKTQLIVLMLIFNHIAMKAITIEQPTRWKQAKNALTSKVAKIIYGTILVSCGVSVVLYNNWLNDQIDNGRKLAPIFDEESLAYSIRTNYFNDEENRIEQRDWDRRNRYILRLRSYRKKDWPVLKSLYADIKAYNIYKKSIQEETLEIHYYSNSRCNSVEITAWG